MDQGLKQQLVGAAVITALAAIFVPMLFDDTVDEAGKTVSELKIPEVPSKAQDVEILPLPDKQEEVATIDEVEQPKPLSADTLAHSAQAKPSPVSVDEGEDDLGAVTAKPQIRLTDRETAVKPAPVASKPKLEAAAIRAQAEDVSEDVDVRPETTKPVVAANPPTAVSKPVKPAPALKPVEEAVSKPATAANTENGNARWYLNAGSFTQKDNAVALQDNLKKQGFAVAIKEVASDKGTIFKVRIGPLLDKAKAQAMKVKLAQINVNSFVSGEE